MTSEGVALTPLVDLAVTVRGRRRRVGLKLEGSNLAGSIKHRTGRALVTSLDECGLLRPATSIIESTSGNLGVAPAALAAERGIGMVAVIDRNVLSPELSLGDGHDRRPQNVTARSYSRSHGDRFIRTCELADHRPWPPW